jgi:predicted permease
MSSSSLWATVVGAFEGSVSVLLTLTAGYAVTRSGLLDRPTIKKMSNVSSLVFLPCLIVVQMGPNLTPGQSPRRARQSTTEQNTFRTSTRGLDCSRLGSRVHTHCTCFRLVGPGSPARRHVQCFSSSSLQKALGLPNWTIVAAGRPNSSALPLLLIEALSSTGVLDELKRPGESTSAVLDRAKSLILLNVVVQQAFTFAAGPSILTGGQHDEDDDRLLPGPRRGGATIQDTEHVGLLHDHSGDEATYGATADPHRFERPLRQLEDQPDMRWPEKLRFLQAPVTKVASFLEPPVVGAIIAVIFGMIPFLHKAFLSEDGTFYNSITKALGNLGGLFVSLQMFTVGAQLASVKSSNPKAVATSYVLLIRYVIMPLLSIAFVWVTAGRGIYENDPLLW